MTGLDIWTIYAHPSDWPDWYVARRWVNDQPTDDAIMAKTLEQLRGLLPEGLTCIARNDGDDPVIVECWL